jgi:hypothetical protein
MLSTLSVIMLTASLSGIAPGVFDIAFSWPLTTAARRLC